MAKTLQYDAGVPMDTRSPFSVKTDPNKIPGDRFADYKPNRSAEKHTVKPDGKIAKKNFMTTPRSRVSSDFVSGAESAERRKRDKDKIIELAKHLYSGQVEKRKIYNEAVKLVDSSEPSNEPDDDKLARARKIIERGPPMNKNEAVEKATEQFYGLGK